MNKKKIILFILVLIIIGAIVYFIINNVSITTSADEDYSNYTPQEEISDERVHQTSITLYFLDKSTNELKSQTKLIDSSELLKNPYKTIVNALLQGPDNNNFESVFPDNTRLIDARILNNCVSLNFSDDILNYKDDTQKFDIINSLLNSLAQLTEVNSIKILINNNTVDKLGEEYSVISQNT